MRGAHFFGLGFVFELAAVALGHDIAAVGADIDHCAAGVLSPMHGILLRLAEEPGREGLW